MSFCPNCGTELNGNPLFCPECGAYLMNADTQEKTAAAAAVQQPSQPQPQPQPAQAQPQYQQQQPQAQQQTYYQPPSNDFQQMPAQTLPQQQIPPQQGYAPSMAPVQEEKASIGLAILSFFIPLVGLILFFVKRKKRPKTAKACLTAAVISVLLSTVMSCFAGKDDTANEIKESISQIAVEDDTTEAKAAAANDVCGKFGDGKYTNAYFDISYTLPDNFAFKSNQEIADIVGSEIDASTGVAKFSQASMDMYYDSAAFSSASGASIMTICVPSGALLKVADLSEKELLEAVTQGVTESYDGAQISDPYSLSVADKSCTAVDVTFSSEGVEMNALYFVTSKNNSYFVTQIISSQYDTSSAKQYIAYFS